MNCSICGSELTTAGCPNALDSRHGFYPAITGFPTPIIDTYITLRVAELNHLRAELATMTAERDRLRAALEKIQNTYSDDAELWMRAIARAALEEK